jgi:hypothetical protein
MHVVIKYISIRCPAQTKSQVKSSCALWVVSCETDLHSKTPAGGAGQLESGTHKYLTRGKSERRVGTHARDTRGPTLIKLVTHRKRIAVVHVTGMVLTRVNPFFEKLGRRTSYMCTERRLWEIHFRKSSTSQAVDCLARTMCDDLAFRVRKKRVHTYSVQYRYHRRQGRVRWGRPLLSRPRGAVDSGPAAVLAAVVC